jgi:hypothetical protein
MVYLRTLNSRMKDFYDVWLLARQFAFDGALLAKAIAATFANRETAIDVCADRVHAGVHRTNLDLRAVDRVPKEAPQPGVPKAALRDRAVPFGVPPPRLASLPGGQALRPTLATGRAVDLGGMGLTFFVFELLAGLGDLLSTPADPAGGGVETAKHQADAEEHHPGEGEVGQADAVALVVAVVPHDGDGDPEDRREDRAQDPVELGDADDHYDADHHVDRQALEDLIHGRSL